MLGRPRAGPSGIYSKREKCNRSDAGTGASVTRLADPLMRREGLEERPSPALPDNHCIVHSISQTLHGGHLCIEVHSQRMNGSDDCIIRGRLVNRTTLLERT
jgi:hypothetical protein